MNWCLYLYRLLVLAVAVGGGGSIKKHATIQSRGEPLPALRAGGYRRTQRLFQPYLPHPSAFTPSYTSSNPTPPTAMPKPQPTYRATYHAVPPPMSQTHPSPQFHAQPPQAPPSHQFPSPPDQPTQSPFPFATFKIGSSSLLLDNNLFFQASFFIGSIGFR